VDVDPALLSAALDGAVYEAFALAGVVAAFTIFPLRMQRVQTRTRTVAPFTTARTDCRLGRWNLRDLRWEWLTLCAA
jgi:hypothetical protein